MSSNKIRCAIVDDEPLVLNLLENYVAKTPSLVLCGAYSNAINALEGLKTEPVDLIFLDIQMPDLSGMEMAKIISPETRIVFTTAFEQYAVDGYKVNALDYLLKPVSYPEFLQTVEKAAKWFSRREARQDSIFVKSDYRLVQIKFSDILYIEGLRDYLKIHLAHETSPVLTLMSMKSMEAGLPSDKFIRVHKSFIINKTWIEAVDRGRIVIGKTSIPVGDNYKANFQKSIGIDG